MKISVKDALKIGGLTKSKVIAGFDGLDNIITCVDILEVPDIINWISEGLLLLTTGYAIKDNSNLQVELIKSMSAHNGAALAIKDNRFFDCIPQAMINMADKLKLPILLIPGHIPYIEITHPLLAQILKSDDKNTEVQNIILELIKNSNKYEEQYIEKLIHNINKDFIFSPPYFLSIIHCKSNKKIEDNLNFFTIKNNSHIIFSSIENRFLFLSSSPGGNWKTYIRDKLLEKNFNKCQNLICLISEPFNDFRFLTINYNKLIETLHIINTISHLKNSNILFYDSISPYLIINSLARQPDIYKIVNNSLKPIIKLNEEEEKNLMINTLYYYVKNFGNKSQASKEAFVHRNTFNYRMNKITKLLNSDLTSNEEIYKYRLFLDIYFMINEKNINGQRLP